MGGGHCRRDVAARAIQWLLRLEHVLGVPQALRHLPRLRVAAGVAPLAGGLVELAVGRGLGLRAEPVGPLPHVLFEPALVTVRATLVLVCAVVGLLHGADVAGVAEGGVLGDAIDLPGPREAREREHSDDDQHPRTTTRPPRATRGCVVLGVFGRGRWIGVSARVASGPRGEEVVLSVSDRGIGVSRSDLHRVFDPFFRSAEASAAGIAGSGLGLAVVRGIAEAHGGRCTAEAVPGTGSTFALHLPVARGAAGKGEPA
ncbi:sensor histidine kinase [Acidobacteria bacterium ACD]|nr:sensor histidine kinase [Acidobacteria bacterium ACD]